MATAQPSVERGPTRPSESPHPGEYWRRRTGWLVFTLSGPLVGLAGYWFEAIPRAFLGLALLVATVTDLHQRKIYNWITYPTACWAIACNLTYSILASATSWVDPGIPDWKGLIGGQSCLLGGLASFMVMLLILMLARGGAGDLKLAVAIGFWLGPYQGLLIIIYCYILAGMFLVCWLMLSHGIFRTVRLLCRGMGRLFLPSIITPNSEEEERLLNQPVPLSPFFAMGTLLVWAGY